MMTQVRAGHQIRNRLHIFAATDNDYEAEEESVGEDIGEVGKKRKRKLGQDDIDSIKKTTAPSGTPAIKNQSGK